MFFKKRNWDNPDFLDGIAVDGFVAKEGFVSAKFNPPDTLDLVLRAPNHINHEALFELLSVHLAKMGVGALNLDIKVGQDLQQKAQRHPRIKCVLAIGSGKGGVGKSTTCVALALALAKLGYRIGVLDADIYGPSLPHMMDATGQVYAEDGKFVPMDTQGIALLSIGHLLDNADTPIAWRGVKATGALVQMFFDTHWPSLDYLLIDLPPGTGDIALTLAQKVRVDGAVVVTTPQNIALLDATKGLNMFIKTGIPVLGVIENMALHICSKCGHGEAIFGTDGGQSLAQRHQVPLLGRLPLDSDIRAKLDTGMPWALFDSSKGVPYMQIAQILAQKTAHLLVDDGRIF